MTAVTMDQANQIIDAALAEGRRNAFMPLTVAVLDPGGCLVALKREDGSGILRPDIAIGKAWAALGMGVPSRILRDRLADRPAFQAALAAASDGRFVAVPGGILLKDPSGAVIGAVGVSGDTSDKDEVAGILGARAARILTEPADPPENWAASKL
ncbi:MAG: GlcG/HbpS family heme-binding protein [Alphaproteobacteria bacterium]